MASNPISINVPANTQGSITCLANAAYFQRVTLSWGGNNVVFAGTGEGQPMKTQDGEYAYLLEATDQNYQIMVTFEYSPDGAGGQFHMAKVRDPVTSPEGIFTVIEVTSEDSTDSDNNDSYLTFSLVTTLETAAPVPVAGAGPVPIGGAGPVPVAGAAPEPAAAGAAGLEIHAKTYYDDPNLQGGGGDEHYISIPSSSSQYLSVQYSGTAWSLLAGGCYDDRTPLGGYLNVAVQLNNCVYAGWAGATLTLNTVISYWGSKPTGYVSVKWDGALYNTQYKLTQVTN